MCLPLWSSLPPLYVAPPKPSRPIPVKCSAERKSPLQVVWDLALITSDHQGDCTFQHVGMDWTKHNNAHCKGGGFGALTSSAVHHIIKIPPFVFLCTGCIQIYCTINKFWTPPHDYPISNTTWFVMDIQRTTSRLPSVTTVDYTYLHGHTWRLALLLKWSFGSVRFCAWQHVWWATPAGSCSAVKSTRPNFQFHRRPNTAAGYKDITLSHLECWLHLLGFHPPLLKITNMAIRKRPHFHHVRGQC